MPSIPKKAARLQVNPDDIPDDDKPPQTGNEFNIWYLRWSGGDSSNKTYSKAQHRCNIVKDSGYTKADKSHNSTLPMCLFFARGCCYLGKRCQYYHRLPAIEDQFNPTQDCFGRDKTSDYKDDMSGVGAIGKVNRTLYVAGLKMNDNIDKQLQTHFSEWGKIDRIRTLYNKNCCFVTYENEHDAQFAKEAMQNQSLDDEEILVIKWANADPNPEAQKREKRKLEELAINKVRELLGKVEESESKRSKITVEEPEEDEPEQQQQLYITEKDSTPNPLNFSQSSLETLKRIRQKMVQPVHKEPPKSLGALMSAYDSSDDDE